MIYKHFALFKIFHPKISEMKNIFTCFLLLAFWCYDIGAQTTVDEFISINARAKDPVHRLNQFRYVRDYHDWEVDINLMSQLKVITLTPPTPPFTNPR